jgi:methionyl-tRNA formyltransferase
MERPLRIVLFGTPQFAVPTLDVLLASDHTVVGVVTQPDRPRGRGQAVTFSAVKDRAIDAGLPVLQPERMKDEPFLDALRALQPDLGVVAAYGRILTDALLALPAQGMINVHASLLPAYRGAAPVHRAVMAGEPETGVTIMRVVRELDAGPMLATVRRRIDPDETSDEVERDLAQLGAELLVRTVDDLSIGIAVETPQDGLQATHAPRVTKEDAPLDWTRPARTLHNQVRGLHPWPHAHTSLRSGRLIVHRTALDAPPAFTAPGTVVEASGDRLFVTTGEGAIRLLLVQPEGKRVMPVRDFLAGHPIPLGYRFP